MDNPTKNVVQNFQTQAQTQVSSSPLSSTPVSTPGSNPGSNPQSASPTTQTTVQSTPQNNQQGQTAQSTTDQFSATNSPSPLQDLQTIDMQTAQNIAGLQSGQYPDTLDMAHLNQYMSLTNLGQLGSQGDVGSGELPKGFDPNQGYYGFLPKQCTSYAAWALNKEGIKFTDTGNGNAKNWPTLAKKQGLNVSTTPQVGSVVCWPSMGQYGHVAVVSGVNKDGTINVSEMNYSPGKYTTRSNVSTSGAQFIK